MKLEINNFSCHAAGYVVGGAEMLVWSILASYYTQEGIVMPLGTDEVVEAILGHPRNRYSKSQIEEAIDNLAGAGRNGPIRLTRLLARAADGTLLPTKAFGIMGDKEIVEALPTPEKSLAELLELLRGLQQKRVALIFKDGFEMDCHLCDVFVARGGQHQGRWVVHIDNGMLQSFDVEEKISDVRVRRRS